jgi:hypothetical protein
MSPLSNVFFFFCFWFFFFYYSTLQTHPLRKEIWSQADDHETKAVSTAKYKVQSRNYECEPHGNDLVFIDIHKKRIKINHYLPYWIESRESKRSPTKCYESLMEFDE